MKTNMKLSIVVIALLFFYGKTVFAQTSQRPNIIFIMTDDQSSIPIDEASASQSRPFGFNGDKYVHTPIIDNLAENGMVFNRAYVSSSVCTSSRYTTLTGRYAGRCESGSFMTDHPLGEMVRPENNAELEEDKENLPRLLQSVGYKTGFVGKSHVVDHHLLNASKTGANGFRIYGQGDDPNIPAVSEAIAYNHNLWTERIKEFGFDYANGVYAANLKEINNDSLNVHNVEWKNKVALEFIEQSGDEPFFLYYSETIPHGPAPWNRKDGKYHNGLDSNPNFTSKGYVEAAYSYLPSRSQIKTEVEALGLDDKHAWLRWFDYAVGAIVDKLQEKGKLENTLIVITSDHGNYNGGKTTIYEGGVKVPLLMYWPAGINAGSTYDELVQNIDYATTFLDLAGVDLKTVDPIDGASLKNVLSGNENPVHDYLYFELGYARGVMTKEWKYITVRYDEETETKIANGNTFNGYNEETIDAPYYTRNKHLGYGAATKNPFYFHRDQLFDLLNDPLETTNIFNAKPDMALMMKKQLYQSLISFPDRPYGDITGDLSLDIHEPLHQSAFKFQIYPNPSKGHFEIKMPNAIQNGTYKVYSMAGVLVKEGSFITNQFQLNLMNVPKGYYMLSVFHEGLSLSEKIMIN